MPILDVTAPGTPDGNLIYGVLYSNQLGQKVVYQAANEQPNISIQIARNDGGSGWPTSLVLTLKDSNDNIDYVAHSSTQTYSAGNDIGVDRSISMTSRFLALEVTTASSQEVPIRISFHQYAS
jgi:hypothetical protein